MKFKKTIAKLKEMPLPPDGKAETRTMGHYGVHGPGEYINLCRICLRPWDEHRSRSVADCLNLLMVRNAELERLCGEEANASREMIGHAHEQMRLRRRNVGEWRKSNYTDRAEIS